MEISTHQLWFLAVFILILFLKGKSAELTGTMTDCWSPASLWIDISTEAAQFDIEGSGCPLAEIPLSLSLLSGA